MSRLFAFLGLIATPILLNAQARNFNLVFAEHAWMKFNGDSLGWNPLSYSASLRNASISDTLGNFQFMVDDSGVRNAVFDLMPGGDATTLGWDSAQSNYLILPRPQHSDQYFVFLNQREEHRRAGYVQADLSQNLLGEVTSAQTTWYMQNTSTKLAATPHADGVGYWVMQHENGSDAFHAYRLTEAGLDTVPVISNAGSAFLPVTGPTTAMDFIGPMKFNVQGDMLALVKQASQPDTSVEEIFHFDNATGEVSFIAQVNNYYLQPNGLGSYWYFDHNHLNGGLDFDAQGAYLYTANWDTTFGVLTGSLVVIQYALSSGDQGQIRQSALSVHGDGGLYGYPAYDTLGSLLMLAPTGALYCRNPDVNSLYPTIGELIDLPRTDSTFTNGVHFIDSPTAIKIGSFPNFCKVYNDNKPAWLGVPSVAEKTQALRVVPNPILDRGVLQLNGNAYPTALRWFDQTGRCVRDQTVVMNSPAVTLDRGGLPSGMYVVEARNRDRIIGRAKVICE